MSKPGLNGREEPCPVCGATDWGIDYVRTADGERPVPDCNVCHWPGPGPVSVEEHRARWKGDASGDI